MKLVATREQGFTIATYRAETRHHIRLGANRDGKLVGYSHEGWEVSSRPDPYVVAGVEDSAQLYAFGAVATKVNVVHADRNTPGFMRSPPVVPYIYALESAMDEMAVKLDMDPVEFRRINDTMTGPDRRQAVFEPLADDVLRPGGRGVRLDEAQRRARLDARRRMAGRLGLRHRGLSDPYRRRRRARAADAERRRARADAAHEIGNGVYTVLGQMAAERLGVDARVGDGRSRRFALAAGAGRRRLQHDREHLQRGDEGLRRHSRQAVPRRGRPRTTGRSPAATSTSWRSRTAESSPPTAPAKISQDVFKRLGVSTIEEYAEFVPQGPQA